MFKEPAEILNFPTKLEEVNRRAIFVILMGLMLVCCIDQPERNCQDYRTGEFWIVIENGGTKDSTLVIRTEDRQIEIYNQRTDTSVVRWLNDCEFVLQLNTPNNKEEEKALGFKILSTTDTSYTFEYGYANAKTRGLKGLAIKKH